MCVCMSSLEIVSEKSFFFVFQATLQTRATRKALYKHNFSPSFDGVRLCASGKTAQQDKTGKFVSANLDIGATRRSHDCELRTQ